MPAHSKEVANKFCALCDWLFQSYQIRKYLIDENPDLDILKEARYEHFFQRLSIILQENWLHQLAKLHDPSVQNGHINLSIEYMIDYGHWDAETQRLLTDLRDRMAILAKPIKDARNKLLSHNDLKIILQDAQLGSFERGQDDDYFCCLRQFASLVSEATVGEPFLYDDLVRNDVEVFMTCFKLGRVQ